MEKLTKKQAKTVKFIKEFIDENSYSPTYKEIAEHFKVNVNAVQQSISALIKKGSLQKVSGIARGLRLKDAMPEELSRVKSNLIVIPLYGNVAAGEPVFADNNIEGYIAVEKPRRAKGDLFSVTVRGDSMIDKKIV